MKIAFGFILNQQFFKDRCGYKTSSYEPGVFYGYIKSEIYLEKKPQSGTSFTGDDLRLRDFLNNKTIETEVLVATRGVASHRMLEDSRSVMLECYGSTYNIEIELLSFKLDETEMKRTPGYKELGIARCKMRLRDLVSEMHIPKGKLAYLPPKSFQWMGVAKYCLNHPEDYYYSGHQHFFARKPRNLKEYLAIYNGDRNGDLKIPTAESVLLDPLPFLNHSNPMTVELARRALTGDL